VSFAQTKPTYDNRAYDCVDLKPLLTHGVLHYLSFQNYLYLQRAYPFHQGQNGPTSKFLIRWSHPSHGVASPRSTLHDHSTSHHMLPLEPPSPSFEDQTQQNSSTIAQGGFEAQPTKPSYRTTCASSMTRHVSHQSFTMQATRSSPPCPHVSACPSCQPPLLVTRLLRSISQDPALVLHVTPLVLLSLKLEHNIMSISMSCV
jgi:hypothetical protein